MEPTKKTYWLTNRLFTEGLVTRHGQDYVSEEGRVYASFPPVQGRWGHEFLAIGVDAHETREGAICQAKMMIARKIASLDKQRAKLLKMAEELK